MRKLSLFMLMAVGLLIGGNLVAQNVAKVDETNYEDINAAFSAWVTNGGTLTILDDVTYEQIKSLTLESNKEYTLDLNGKTLTWIGKLIYEDTDADRANHPDGAIYITTGSETTLNIQSSSVGGNIVFNGEHSYWRISSNQHKQSHSSFYFIKLMGGTLNWKSGDISVNGKDGTEYVSSIIYIYGSAKVDVTGGKFTTLDYSYTVMYINSDAEVSLQNCEMKLVSQQKANTGVYCYNKLTTSATLTNVTIDASGVGSTKAGKCVEVGGSSYGDIIVNSGTYTANSYSSAYAANGNGIIIKGGTFNGKVTTKSNGIEGGQFSVEPDYNYAAEGKHFVLNGDYYELADGGYVFYNMDLKKAYLNAESCWDECSTTEGTYHTIKPLTSDNFTIPEGKYVNLYVGLSETLSPTITNNGHVQHQTYSWKGGTLINNGEFTHTGTMSLNTGFTLINNGIASFSANADGCTITNNETGVINIQGKSKTYKNITLSNAGIINVYMGTFDKTSYDAFFTNGNANLLGTGSWGEDKSGNPQYVVVADPEAYVGTTGYTTLREALAVSTETKYATLSKDVYITTYNGTTLSGYLDLNGHSIIGKYTYESSALINVSSADLHIKDGSVEQTGKIYRDQEMSSSKDGGIIEVSLGQTVYLEGGSIIGTGANALDYTISTYPNHANNGGHIVIDGATIIGEAYGIAVWDSGTLEIKSGSVTVTDGYAILNNGTITDPTTMTISGGTVFGSQQGIYHPGIGTLTISGGEITGGYTGVEMRAGTLNMTAGKVASTYIGSESESWGNGNGATTLGVGIVVAQHTTKKTVSATISGGDIEGVIPVKLANPEKNSEADINKVKVSIEGGRYKVVNGAGAPFWSATENFTVSAGKFSHVPAYVVAGKTVVPNTGDDKDIYPWTIGVVNGTPVVPTGDDITWQDATQWPDGKIPTSQDIVSLTEGQNVVVSGTSDDDVAQAYEITIGEGATLTVESGATLVIGGGGITNNNEENIGLKVEPGAQVIVSPDADMTGLYGRVALKPNVGKYPADMVGEYVNKPNRYQLVGIPTKGQPTISKNKADGDGFKLNQWDVETGWKAADLTDFSVPFKGFFFWNDVDLAMNATDDASRVTYYFKGELFGNKPQTLVFTEHEGFHLFANSYLAEVDIMALIQGAENNVQKAVYVYDPVAEKFTDISYATYGKPGMPSAIQPMQGFYFLNQHDANTTAPMDYVSMVWSNAFKVEQEFVPSNAPRRNAAIDGSEVRINITDNVVGRTDGVYVMENDKYSAELDGSDVQKMMNPATSVNIYATTTVGKLSTMQTNDIENQYLTIETNAAPMYTMSFDWVAGDELYLLDTYNGRTTLMTEGNTYEFAAQPKSIINDRFQIVKTAAQAPTTIENVKNIKAVKGTYTVTGQCLGENVDWNKLPQGVYVIDGVKVVK